MCVYLCVDPGTRYSDLHYEVSLSAERQVHYTGEEQKFFKVIAVFVLNRNLTKPTCLALLAQTKELSYSLPLSLILEIDNSQTVCRQLYVLAFFHHMVPAQLNSTYLLLVSGTLFSTANVTCLV